MSIVHLTLFRIETGTTYRAGWWFRPATVALLLSGFAAGADAQTPATAPNWSVSPSAGVILDPDGRAGGTLAGAVGYEVSPRITLEGEVAHIFDTAHDDPDVALTLSTATLSMLYRWGAGRLTPHVAAGVGAGWFTHALRTPEVDVGVTAFGVNVGVGAMYALRPRVLTRADFRYMNHTHGSTSDPQQILTVDDVPTVWRFTGGLTIRLPQ